MQQALVGRHPNYSQETKRVLLDIELGCNSLRVFLRLQQRWTAPLPRNSHRWTLLRTWTEPERAGPCLAEDSGGRCQTTGKRFRRREKLPSQRGPQRQMFPGANSLVVPVPPLHRSPRRRRRRRRQQRPRAKWDRGESRRKGV
jgi:hypothetical protein